MATLATIYIKKETLQQIITVLNNKTGDESKGVNITISQNDESNKYGQNVTGWITQTKEQREAKKERFFVGNGKVVWTKGETPIGVKSEEQPIQNTSQQPTQVEEDPF